MTTADVRGSLLFFCGASTFLLGCAGPFLCDATAVLVVSFPFLFVSLPTT